MNSSPFVEWIRWPKVIFWLLAVSLILRLIAAGLLPMTSDETYYWVWSHHMQLSFFDHPPAVAWLFWLSHPLDNLGSSCRFAGVLLSQATLCLWLMILRPLLDDRQLKIWLGLSLLSPLFGAGGLLITPDIPLLFFWALSLLLFIHWLKQPSPLWSTLLGLSCGLGFCSKYVMVLEPMFLFFACLAMPSWRTPMRRGWFWILVGTIAGATPAWLWNLQNDFISFRFQADHGLGETQWKPQWTVEYILGEVGLIFPTVLYWAIRGTKRSPVWLWLLAWGPLLFFVLTSYRGHMEVNWPIVSYPAVFGLAALWLTQPSRWLNGTLMLWGTALIAILILIVTRWSPTGEPIRSREFFQFEVLAPLAKTHDPVFARSYQMASSLSFTLKKPISKLKDMNRPDFFDFLPESTPTGSLFYFFAEKTDFLPKVYEEHGWRIISKTPVAGSDLFDFWEVRK